MVSKLASVIIESAIWVPKICLSIPNIYFHSEQRENEGIHSSLNKTPLSAYSSSKLKSNWDFAIFLIEERGKPECLEKNLSTRVESQHPTYMTDQGHSTLVAGECPHHSTSAKTKRAFYFTTSLNRKMSFTTLAWYPHLYVPFVKENVNLSDTFL